MTDGRQREFADMVCATVLAALGAGAALMALRYGLKGTHHNIGPGATPFIAAVILLLLSAAAAIRAAIRFSHAPASVSLDEGLDISDSSPVIPAADDGAENGEVDPMKPWKILGLTLVAAVASSWIGQLLSFSILVLVLLTLIERRPIWQSLLIAVCAGCSIWLVFVHFLYIPLS
jgi:hypothetical protein